MKRLILAALFVAAACSPRETYTTGSFDVSPLPRTVSADTTAAPFVFNGSTVIVCDEGLEDAAGLLWEGLLEATGLVVPVSDRSGKNAVELHIDHAVGEGLEDWRREESYLIESGEEGLRISGFSVIGVIHGIQTVLKALPVGGEGLRALPAARVEDWPEFAFRGFMLDVGRHFFGKDYILKLIDILSLHNINYFHWHLSEDQGWRIEIKKYPLLTEIGSYRSGSPVKGAEGHDGVPVSGFYTQEEAREVVSYAAARGITVIPEIDLPGHMQAALASYPSLGCTGGPYEVATQYGVLDDVLCVGKDGTLGFVKDVLSELLEIFPSPYFHLGGDECPKVRWEKCPDCQAKIRELGLSDFGGISAEDRLQSWFMAEAEAFLAENGRVMIGWNDILCDWRQGLRNSGENDGYRSVDAAGISCHRCPGGLQDHNVPGGLLLFQQCGAESADRAVFNRTGL